MRQKLSIILPAYNEEKRLDKTLTKIKSFLSRKKLPYEVIVVDDSSDDRTREVAKKYNVKVISNKKNMGKGFSVKRGVFNSSGSLILFSDVDLSTPIEELDKFLKYIRKYDAVIASRYLPESNVKVKQPLPRIIAARTFNLIIRIILGLKYKDTQCGFKLFKRGVALKLFKNQRINGFAFDAELLFLARKFKFNVKEVGVVWINSRKNRFNALREPPKMLKDIIRIRVNDLKGRYN